MKERERGGEEIYKHSGSFMLSINNRLVFPFNGTHNGEEKDTHAKTHTYNFLGCLGTVYK